MTALLASPGAAPASLGRRLRLFTAAVLIASVAAVTAAAIWLQTWSVRNVERDVANAFLGHLAGMPEMRATLARAEHAVASLNDAAPADSRFTVAPASEVPRPPEVAAVPLAIAEHGYSLRYLSSDAKVNESMLRAMILHATLGLAALVTLLVGIEWLVRRRLLATVRALSHQVRHMSHGGGWEARLPATDIELSDLASALKELGPALDAQTRQWIAAERRVAVVTALREVRERSSGDVRRALVCIGEAIAHRHAGPAAIPALRSAVVEIEHLAAIPDEVERTLLPADALALIRAASASRKPLESEEVQT